MKEKARITTLAVGILLLGLAWGIAGRARQIVGEGDTVTVHYTITLEDGTVYQTTFGGEPLRETLGEGKMIPGFEEALTGMRTGETRTVTIPPEKAYGMVRADLVGPVSRERLPQGVEPLAGKQLWVRLDDGSQVLTVITDLTDSSVTLDGNHPLAGQSLIFDIELVALEKTQLFAFINGRAVSSWLLPLSVFLVAVYHLSIAWKRILLTRTGKTGRNLQKLHLSQPVEKDSVENILNNIKKRKGDTVRAGRSWGARIGILLLSTGAIILASVFIFEFRGKRAGPGDAVRIHYTLRLDDGSVFGSSLEGEPLPVILGEGRLLPDFEIAIEGMRIGESRTVLIPAGNAYGPFRPELVTVFSRSDMPEGLNLEVGGQLQATGVDGSPVLMTITNVSEQTVTLDANHPLAGENLSYEVQLVGIEARQEAGVQGSSLVSGWLLLAVLVIGLGILIYTFRIRRAIQPAQK